ncbi:MAG TPA: hypothetical protein VM074_08410 [Solimonas sp.]|nr:hypothetical protein [Solimonas sp.]
MKISRFVSLACLWLPLAAAANPLEGGDTYVTLGGGYYNGNDYPPDPNASTPEASSVDGGAAHLSLTNTNVVLLRVRGSWYFDYTSNVAEEVAGLVGLPLTTDHNVWFNAGVSRLTDVSNKQQSPTVGFPLELVYYPVRGFELMVHGNINKDSNFIGIAVGGAIGRQRPK